jgi:hypothetical protein|tara:strand:+ start:5371 stop:5580 length:210 start_codon:yes stop_codon:yes gene_type:complete
MDQEKKVPEILFLHQVDINHKLKSHLYWHETFIDYIKKADVELYKLGVKYTDDLKDNGYFTEEEISKMK